MSANRIGALMGVAFLVIAIVAIAIAGGEPPDPSDESAQEIVDFYADKEDGVFFAAILQVVAAVALAYFGGYLRKVLQAAEGPGHVLSAVTLAGASILAVALAVDASINIALAEAHDDVEPAAVQALSALWASDFPLFALGGIVFVSSAGLSVIRHGALPKWLGWVAIVIAISMVTPAGFIGFVATALWIAIVSVILALRADDAAATI